jgi:hypothetical protein
MKNNMDARFNFIGSILQKNSFNKFTVSIYEDAEGNPYRHIIKDDIIEGFEQVILAAEVNKVDVALPVDIGSKAIYCFTDKQNKLTWGTRASLEAPLSELLFAGIITVQARIIISSFLQLHGKTYELIQEKQKQLEKAGIQIKSQDFISTKNIKKWKKNAVDLNKILFDKYNHFKKIAPGVYLSDIVLLKNAKLHFNQIRTNIDLIIGYKNESTSAKIKELIRFSIESDRMDLEISFKKSKRLYRYLLTSDIEITQRKIDTIISESINEVEDEEISVLEIGFRVDLELSGFLESTNEEVVTEYEILECEQILKDAKDIMKKK